MWDTIFVGQKERKQKARNIILEADKQIKEASFRQLYQETVSDLQTELKAALVDLGHKSASDLLLKEAWNPEQAAMGNSTRQDV